MANRSYLYAVDGIPTSQNSPKKIVSLSEWRYDIPLIYRVLIASSTQLCTSVIVDDTARVALASDAKAGMDNFRKLQRLVQSTSPAEEVNNEFEAMIAFLEKQIADCPYILLEPFELVEMMAEVDEEQTTKILHECQSVLEPLEAGNYEALGIPRESTLEDWDTKLGLYWSDILYFDFTENSNDSRESSELSDEELFKVRQGETLDKDYFYIPKIFCEGRESQYRTQTAPRIRYSLRYDDGKSVSSDTSYASKVPASQTLELAIKNDLVRDFKFSSHERLSILNIERYDTAKNKHGVTLTRILVTIYVDKLFDVKYAHPVGLQLWWKSDL